MNLHRDLTRATVKAVQWLSQQNQEITVNPHTHGLFFASMKLTGYDSHQVSCRKANNETFEKLLEPAVFSDLSIGEMAYVLIGARASCYKQSIINYKWQLKVLRNKLRMTSKIDCNNLFEYSLGIIAILAHTDDLSVSIANKAIIKSTKSCTSLDSKAMFALALNAIYKQKTMYKILKKASKYNFEEVLYEVTKQYSKEPIKDNIYGFSILAQVLAERQHYSLYYRHFLKRIQKELLQLQQDDGSYGNLITTIHVLPALTTSGLLDLMDMKCPTNDNSYGVTTTTKPLKMIKVIYQVNIPNKIKATDRQVNITIQSGATAFDGLKLASGIDTCYQHQYKHTDWGIFLKKICQHHQSDADGLYWLYYVNGNASSVGISSYTLKDGDVITLSYGAL